VDVWRESGFDRRLCCDLDGGAWPLLYNLQPEEVDAVVDSGCARHPLDKIMVNEAAPTAT